MREKELKSGCLLPPSEELRKGIDEFNAGAWFECHETLEDLWAGEKGEARDLYQGILQIAAALYHWRNGNYRGSMRLIETGTKLLCRIAPICMEVDVAALVRDAERFRQGLEQLWPESMAEIDGDLVPRIRMTEAGGNSGETNHEG